MIRFILQGEKLHFDEEHLSVDEARQIKRHAGLSVRAFLDGLKEYDVDAVVALVWLARHRAGDPVPWDAVSFDLLGDLEIIPEDEGDDAGPPPVAGMSTSTTPPSRASTLTGTGATGSARSRTTSGTPPPTLTP